MINTDTTLSTSWKQAKQVRAVMDAVWLIDRLIIDVTNDPEFDLYDSRHDSLCAIDTLVRAKRHLLQEKF